MATVGRLKFVTLINPSGGGNNFPFIHVRNDTFETLEYSLGRALLFRAADSIDYLNTYFLP